MSTTVTYKGSTLTTINNQTKTLKTAGKYMEGDVILVDVTESGSGSGVVWQDGQGYIHLSDEGDIELQTKTVTPTETAQTITADAGYYALEKVNVGAISSTYVGTGITRRSSSDLTASGATVTVPSGYYSAQASKAVASGTEGTPTATKGTVSNHSVSVTPSVTNTAGYISGGTKTGTAVTVSASELVSGTYNVTSSGTKDVTNYASASVPSGTAGTPTATKGTVSNHSVSVTPSVTNTSGYITGSTKTGTAVTVSASELVSGTYSVTSSGTSDVTNYASVSVSSLKLPTTATTPATGTKKGSISTSLNTQYLNIPTGYNNTAQYYEIEPMDVDAKSITENGTYYAYMDGLNGYSSVTVNVSGGGSGSGVSIAYSEAGSNSSSISFSDLEGEPTSFYILYDDSTMSLPSGTPYKIVGVVYDGTDLHGQIATNTNNAQASYSTDLTKSYSNGTLTVTSTNLTFAGIYTIAYTYGGSASNIDTKEVQVGSGATSITFTGLSKQPLYWSCIFKSNFSTSSGYQRVMIVGDNNIRVIGACLDSNVKISNSYWSYSYNNGTLTITSQGTNSGGYFHQPGYYQLTYVYESSEGGESSYQTKTVTPTTSQQVITADSGYDALSQVTVNAMPTGTAGTPTATKGTVSNHSISITPSVTNTTGYITGSTKTGTAVTVTASELASGNKAITQNGTGIDVVGYSTVSVNVAGTPTIQSLTINPSTTQQTFNASSVDGYKPVTVAAVSQTNLTAANIKSGTTVTISNGTNNIYSVTGTYSGGGANNLVQGTFTAGTAGSVQTINIPYTGNGYPIALAISVEGGTYANASGNTNAQTWYDTIHQYAIGYYSMSKCAATNTPQYVGTSVFIDGATVMYAYKSSTTNNTAYSRYYNMTGLIYKTGQPETSGTTIVTISSSTTLNIRIAGNSSETGFLSGLVYSYYVVYSE